ncbi:MAG: hypothetical protein JJE37_00850 [Methyloceanibacter sp.]|jgi:hypothetical protein|nr:hypothetical protein [Methyloceanibacter sp.]
MVASFIIASLSHGTLQPDKRRRRERRMQLSDPSLLEEFLKLKYAMMGGLQG